MESEINASAEQIVAEVPVSPGSRNYGNVEPEEGSKGQSTRSNQAEAPKKSPKAQT